MKIKYILKKIQFEDLLINNIKQIKNIQQEQQHPETKLKQEKFQHEVKCPLTLILNREKQTP